MTISETLKLAVQSPVYLLGRIPEDMTDEQLHWNPSGTAHSVAASLAHAALSTDWQIHDLFEGGAPMFASAWEGRTGVSQPQPAQTLEWAQNVVVDLPVFQKYANEVYSRLDTYLGGRSTEDLARTIDLSIAGLGEQTLEWAILTVVVGHLNQLTGEMAAVKGMQGLQGYP